MTRHSKKRFREQQQFWLDLNKPEEAALSKKIAQLKTDREFVATVRQGIALVTALRQGDLSLFEEMFPQVVDDIFQAGADSVAYKPDEGRVEEKLATLTSMVSGLSSLTASPVPEPLMVSGNLKAHSGPDKPFTGPDDDDDLADLLEVKDVSSETVNAAAQNLINSLLRTQQIKSDKRSKPGKAVKRERESLDDLIEIKTEGSA